SASVSLSASASVSLSASASVSASVSLSASASVSLSASASRVVVEVGGYSNNIVLISTYNGNPGC
ncbi:uncharacterized protein LOC126251455, partial [Schistocerca nitens]|uniref:uncharacterized protein LOC126251455 n=1 Tax=Schistocerca nitens TaxID=7011 RepID=UPI002119618C